MVDNLDDLMLQLLDVFRVEVLLQQVQILLHGVLNLLQVLGADHLADQIVQFGGVRQDVLGQQVVGDLACTASFAVDSGQQNDGEGDRGDYVKNV